MAGVTKQGEQLLVSFELGLERWKLAVAKDLSSPKRVREIAARDLGAVKREIAKARKALGLTEKAQLLSCYEAGRDGFWLHRWLQRRGDCLKSQCGNELSYSPLLLPIYFDPYFRRAAAAVADQAI